jgi:hypothetical protein
VAAKVDGFQTLRVPAKADSREVLGFCRRDCKGEIMVCNYTNVANYGTLPLAPVRVSRSFMHIPSVRQTESLLQFYSSIGRWVRFSNYTE